MPGDAATGRRFMRCLTEHLGPDRAAIVLISPAQENAISQFKVLRLPLPGAPTINRSMNISKAEQTIYWLFRQRFFKKLEKYVEEIASFAAKNQVSYLVSVLDHPANIWLTRKVADALKIRYSTFTASLPDVVLQEEGYDSQSCNQIGREFVEVLKSAQSAGFASLPMANYYSEKHSVNGIEIPLPAQPDPLVPTIASKEKRGEIVIGSLINPKFMEGTQALIEACQAINWQTEEKRISLRLLGSIACLPFKFGGKPAEIEILGGLSRSETVVALKECTLNFLPFVSEKGQARRSLLCLPDDFPTYIEAERPLLVRALKPSLIEDTMREFSLGITLESLSENLFIPALKTLLDAGQNKDLTANFQRLRQERFAESAFAAGIRNLLPSPYIEKNSTA